MKTRGQAVPQFTDQPAKEQRDAARKVYRAVTARFKNGNQSVQDLAEAMVMPCMAALRFPTQDMPRTSVTICTDQRNVSSPTVAYSSFPTGDLLIAFFGQPGRLAMIYGPITSGGIGIWYFTPSSATSAQAGPSKKIEIPASTTQTTPVGVWLDPAAVALDVPIHGQTQTVGKQDNHTYLWLNTGDVINFSYQVSAVPNQGTIMMRAVRYSGPNSPYEDIDKFSMGVTSTGSGSYTHSSAAGYIAFVVDGYSATTGTTGIVAGSLLFTGVTTAYAGGVGWMQVSLADCDPNAAGDMNMMEEARVNGASLLATNVSSALNRQGTVLAARMRQVPFWKVTPAMLGRAAEKYQGDAIHGCYTFFEFSDTRQTFVNCNTEYAAAFDLDYNDYYHFIELSCPAYATAPNSYAIKFDTMIEYKTDIGRYGKATSEYTFQDLVAARRLINSQPVWFYENPTHAKQLYGLIKRALGGAWKVGKRIAPYALNAASAANPELAPLLQALKLAL